MAERDRGAVVALADRLTTGVAQWRSPDLVLCAVRSWVAADVDGMRDGKDRMMVFVAAVGDQVVGFVAVAEDEHWTGERDAYIGELVVHPGSERRGIATQLVRTAGHWAATRGLRRIRLSTGAANTPALRVYDALGYQREDITLSRSIAAAADPIRPDDAAD